MTDLGLDYKELPFFSVLDISFGALFLSFLFERVSVHRKVN